jgi:hypothetical protein
MLSLLTLAGLNVQNAYGTVLGDNKTAILVIDVEDTEHVQQIFDSAGVQALTSKEVYGL